MRVSADHPRPNRLTSELPAHLADWQLPPEWRWGGEGVVAEYRHYQEIIDALGRSLSLVTRAGPGAPRVARGGSAVSRRIAIIRRFRRRITTGRRTRDVRRGPGLPASLDRRRNGRRARSAHGRGGRARTCCGCCVRSGSTVAYLHDAGVAHGALSPEHVWVAPTGRLWLLGWQWAVPRRGSSGRRRARPAVDADGAGMGDRRTGLRRRERPVAARRRCASRRSPARCRRRAKRRRCDSCAPMCRRPSPSALDRALSREPGRAASVDRRRCCVRSIARRRRAA